MSRASCERTGDLIVFATNMARLQEAGKTNATYLKQAISPYCSELHSK
ncbi:MAG: hypothetical protein ACI9FG_001130 [Crocinitomicaceae bacterium]|jgi:hypothetical protein